MQHRPSHRLRGFLSFLLVVAVFAGACVEPCLASEPRILQLDSAVLDTASQPFIPHTGSGFFQSYVVLTVPYEPVKSLWKQLERELGRKLVNRGEAHVTVITPPEYEKCLKSHLSIEKITDIARFFPLQKASLDVICLGRGTAVVDGTTEDTYYLVVDSPLLLDVRRAVHAAFVEGGGDPLAFDPGNFYPHITVGFTKRDLHEADGVVKNAASCDSRFRLNVVP